jgi:hypothetical protein
MTVEANTGLPKPALPPFRGKTAYRTLKKMGLPLAANLQLLRSTKRLLAARTVREREALYKPESFSRRYEIPEDKGYLRFSDADNPAIRAARAMCDAMFDERIADGEQEGMRTNRKKAFLLRLFSHEQFLNYPEFVRLVTDRDIVDAAALYLGGIPLLAAAELWWSPPNESLTASQIMHTDSEDARQVKLFVCVRDIEADQGPFTFLPADASERIRRDLSRIRTRYTDEQVSAAAGAEEPIVFTGKAGDCALVDSSRCLHYGSRGNRRSRAMIMVQYLRYDVPHSRFEALWPRAGTDRPPVDLTALDPVQRAVLGYC